MLFGFDDAEPEQQEERALQQDHHPTQEAAAPSRIRWLYLALGLLLGLVVAATAWVLKPDQTESLTQTDVDSAINDALAAFDEQPAAAALVFDQIAPSLVVIRAIGDSSDDETSNIGSGVVINDQGQILTSSHVVATASSIELLFADGTETSAQLVTNDTALDIAVLEASQLPQTLVPAVLGNSRTIQIGDPVFAVGNPLGLTGSITAGVVSGLGRNIPFPDSDDLVLEDLIQFDAAVNQGNSGGPLLNRHGQVIGIVTALADPAGQGFFIGIGFAVPIDIAAGGAANGPSQ